MSTARSATTGSRSVLLRSRNVEIPWGDASDLPEVDSVCGIGNRKNAAFASALHREGIAPYPGSLELIRQLHEEGIPQGIVSSSQNAEAVLEKAGIRDFFTVVIDGRVAERDALASKPAPDMFRAGAVALGVTPGASVAVEDALGGSGIGRRGRFRRRRRRPRCRCRRTARGRCYRHRR